MRTYKFCLAAVAGDSQVNLTWIPSAPGNNFTIYDGTAPGIGKPVKPDTVTDSGALVTGLTNGTTYYFWLTVGTARDRSDEHDVRHPGGRAGAAHRADRDPG